MTAEALKTIKAPKSTRATTAPNKILSDWSCLAIQTLVTCTFGVRELAPAFSAADSSAVSRFYISERPNELLCPRPLGGEGGSTRRFHQPRRDGGGGPSPTCLSHPLHYQHQAQHLLH